MNKQTYKNFLKGAKKVTFTKTNMEYRIAFDSASNRFMAIDAKNETNIAYGITIEEAIRNLHR